MVTSVEGRLVVSLQAGEAVFEVEILTRLKEEDGSEAVAEVE